MRTVRFWLDQVMEANRRDHSAKLGGGASAPGPGASARAQAIVLMAMHDAWFAVTQPARCYRPVSAPPPGLAPAQAAAAAAHHALTSLYTGPRHQAPLADAWAFFTRVHTVGAAAAAFGATVATGMLDWRSGDPPLLAAVGPGGVPHYKPSGAPYDHDVDPLHPDQGFLNPIWGQAQPFIAPIQPLTLPAGRGANAGFTMTPHYAQEYADVRDLGRETGGSRTQEQEEIGILWAYDGVENLGTPPRLYMQVALKVLDGFAARAGTWLNEVKLLEVCCAIAVAMADAGIQAWHYKYSPRHMLWRPVLGIRKADHASTPADPYWRPLGAPRTNSTPPDLAFSPGFPAYPSGHATFGAAAFHVLRRFLDRNDASVTIDADGVDNVAFAFTSDELDGQSVDPRTCRPRPRVTRLHASLWQAIVENSVSRVYLGVHWRMDGITTTDAGGTTVFGTPATPKQMGTMGGTRLGMDIADVVATARGF
jgi:vanadium chloroperoxidase